MKTLNDIVKQKLNEKLERGKLAVQKNSEVLQKIVENTHDFLVPLNLIPFQNNGRVTGNIEVTRKVGDESWQQDMIHFTLHKNAVGQMAEKLRIPQTYLGRLVSSTHDWERDIAAEILNRTAQHNDKNYLLRIVEDKQPELRGFLSDKYKRLNSLTIMGAFVQAIRKTGGVISDMFVDATRWNIDTIAPQPVEIDTPNNGKIAVAVGVRLSNSDFGDGALKVQAYFIQGVCLNGMTSQNVLKAVHLGRKLEEDMVFSDKTYLLDTKTQASAIEDMVRFIYSDEYKAGLIESIKAASGMKIDMGTAIKNVSNYMQKHEVKALESVLMSGRKDDGVDGEPTVWKLLNGITAVARDTEGRRAKELEDYAGQLMEKYIKA